MTAPPGSGLMLEAAGIEKRFGVHHVLRGVDLQVAAGEVVAVIGPSGGGKSTLLRCINFLEKPDAGIVRVDGQLMGYTMASGKLREVSHRHLRAQRTSIGMVFQAFNLFENMTILDNVMEAPRCVRGLTKADAQERAMALLRRVGMGQKAASYPSHVSGGQRQRAAIARALAMEPKLMLLDEPTSSLDPELVGEVLQVIAELAEIGMTLVIVTHEVGFAREVADRVVFIADGVVEEAGPAAEVLSAPRQERTKAFLRTVLS
jgi:polar amino acid transport system ATP-binding protein